MAASSDERPTTSEDVLTRLANDVLPTLVARLERSRLGELEVRQDGWRVRLRRAPLLLDGAEQAAAAPARRADRRSDRPSTDRSAETSVDGRPQPLRSVDGGPTAVTSPGVGYYVPRDGLAVGASLRSGDLIGHVDVLGVRHEVVAPTDGVLAALDVQPGQAVEYGQQLALLERSRGSTRTDSEVS